MMQFNIVYNVWAEWPIGIKIHGIYPAGDINRVLDWCHQTFGDPGDTLRWRDTTGLGAIYLIREEDLTLFLLKWKT